MIRKKLLVWLLVLLVVVIGWTVFPAAGFANVPQTDAVPSVVDSAGLLTDQQKKTLLARIQEVEQEHGVRIGIVTMKSLKGKEPKAAADEIVLRDYANGTHGGMVLLLVMSSRDRYVSTDSHMRKIITDEEGFPYLSDQFLPDLKDGNYADAFMAYVNTADMMLTYYETEGEPYDPIVEFSLLSLVIAICLAGLIAALAWSILMGQLNNVQPAVSADDYLQRDSIQLDESKDTFLYMNVTRVKKAKKRDSSSSGSSSCGGGGGKF
ncbi:TPM domain-containing protein [Selenomonas ruminis]|uniref:TPM domain-containing protein n=1 Tax=Selenomonas ruminis TaxID=2593411 RepID=A0A5D6W3Q0_9FIRM|nr:TPM domain-containing protein [Selenomonas sp. mPRGC5]TYZ22516.1 TPM domain-containing protein [Selenomonas sp. mPRGC5]